MARRDPGSKKPPGLGRGQCAVSDVSRYVAPVTEAAAVEFLRARFGSAAHINVMRPGEWSAAYGVRTSEADLVARFSVYDEDFEKDAYAARYCSPTLPIPTIIEWGPALGGFYALAERMTGEHIDGLDETRMRRDARDRPIGCVGVRRVARRREDDTRDVARKAPRYRHRAGDSGRPKLA